MGGLKAIERVLLGATAAALLLYFGDWASLRYHIPSRDTFDVVKVDTYFTVPRKDGRDEYYPGSEQDQKCVRSIFPHFGYDPCWLVRRQKEKHVSL
jgi:hypothetical protein